MNQQDTITIQYIDTHTEVERYTPKNPKQEDDIRRPIVGTPYESWSKSDLGIYIEFQKVQGLYYKWIPFTSIKSITIRHISIEP